MLALLKTLWRHWKGLAHRIIAAQNWLVMAVAYGVAIWGCHGGGSINFRF